MFDFFKTFLLPFDFGMVPRHPEERRAYLLTSWELCLSDIFGTSRFRSHYPRKTVGGAFNSAE